jgi:AraC family transcriptional regulator of arabinose operon
MAEPCAHLDDSPVWPPWHTDRVSIADGFRGERLCVVPRPLVDAALRRPVTRKLVVTDAGWFPEAAKHARSRSRGTPETIVIVCVSGSGWIEVQGVRHRIGASTAVVIPGSTPHSYGASDSNPWTIWWCHLLGTDVADLVAATGVEPTKPVVPLRNPDRAALLIDEVVRGLERDQSPARLIGVAGAAWKLMTQLATDQVLPEHGDPLQRAMNYLEERLDSTVRVADLAALVGVSPSHLSAQFNRATGGGVLAHHSALRMAAARRLLDSTTLSIGEIAGEVGYRDPFYFSRHFRRSHGVSPTEYRGTRKG